MARPQVTSGPEESSVIARAVERPVGVSMAVAALVVFGAVSFTKLPYQLLPDLTYPRLTIRTVYPGAAPEDVEERVTRPLEESLSVLKDLRSVGSTSRAEVSEIRLQFNWDVDLTSVIAEAREKIDQTFLPRDAERPTCLRYDPRLEPVLVFAASSDRSLRELRWIAEEKIERALEAVEGTAAVKVRGGLEEEIEVALHEGKLAAYGLTAEGVLAKLVESNVNQPAGLIRRGDRSFLVRVLNEFQNEKDIEEVVLDPVRDLRVRHVATVRRSHRDPSVLSRLDGRSCVRVEVYREAAVNPVVLARRVKAFVFGTRPGTGLVGELPPGVRLTVLRDQSRFIAGAIEDVTRTLVQGGLLAGVVLFCFLRDVRSTVLVAGTIPISVIITFTPLFLAGVSLNIMSLGGLALGAGMLVDNAIVATESIARLRSGGLDRRTAAVRGAGEIAGAVTASTLTTVAVFFPIVFLSGVAAELFRDQALSVIWALVASLAVALTFLPTMIASGGREPGGGRFPWPATTPAGVFRREDTAGNAETHVRVAAALLTFPLSVLRCLAVCLAWVVCGAAYVAILPIRALSTRLQVAAVEARSEFFFTQPYRRALRACLHHPLRVLLLTAAVGWLAVAATKQIGSELIPELVQGEFTVQVRLPVGTPIERTDAVLASLCEKIRSSPEVRHVGSTAGVDPEDIQHTGEGPHTGRIEVKLRRTEKGYAASEQKVRSLIRGLLSDPVIETARFSRPVLFTWESGLEVIVKRRDLNVLRSEAGKIEAVLKELPALGEIENSMRAGQPELHIEFDRVLLARAGLTVGAAAGALRRKVQGEVRTTFPEPGRNVDIRVRLEQGRNLGRFELAELVIGYNKGRAVKLREVAQIRSGRGPAEIERRDGQRCAVLVASVLGLDLGHAAGAVMEALREAGIENVSLGGQSHHMAESRASLERALALAVFLVYVVMASQFESLLAPLIIIFSVPLAFVGVSFLLAATGVRLSVVVLIGFVLLAGIVVNNAIVMVDYIGRLRRRGLGLHEAVLEGAATRLRPVLMTTLTTVLGLVPFTGILSAIPHGPVLDLVLGSGQGQELRSPLAWTVIAGLSSSTLLTLFVIPTLYRLVEGLRDRSSSEREQ